MAPTGVGKTAWMAATATDHLMMGYNVVYFTLEMSELEISKRIDANKLNIDINELGNLGIEDYGPKFESLASLTKGDIRVKEYPPTQAGYTHFRNFLEELRIKQNFVPDIIYVDYLNLCASIGSSREANSYDRVKRVSEEIRGLAVETNTAVISATQTNRQGFRSSDFDMDATSDSFGLPMTADFFLALITSEELEAQGQIQMKQLKNRYGDKNKNNRFLVGIDRAKMRFYDLELRAQDNVVDLALFDRTTFGLENKFLGLDNLGL
jgi:hypothetical protein